MLILVWRRRRERRDLSVLAVLVFVLVVVQALVGAFVVWQELAAALVGFHYTVSVVIVCIAAAFLVRMYEPGGSRQIAVPKPYAILTHVTSAVLAVTVVVGVVTTASGPHSGDEDVIRTGVDASILAHVHSWPGYALLVLTLALVVAAWRLKLPTLRWSIALLAIELVQVGVGLYQSRNGLPVLAVGVHMVLAALTAAAMTVVIMRLKRPVAADAARETSPVEASAR